MIILVERSYCYSSSSDLWGKECLLFSYKVLVVVVSMLMSCMVSETVCYMLSGTAAEFFLYGSMIQ